MHQWHARLPRGNGAGPAAVDSKHHGLASMACLGSLAAAQRHRSTSVQRHRSKPVRPIAPLFGRVHCGTSKQGAGDESTAEGGVHTHPSFSVREQSCARGSRVNVAISTCSVGSVQGPIRNRRFGLPPERLRRPQIPAQSSEYSPGIEYR